MTRILVVLMTYFFMLMMTFSCNNSKSKNDFGETAKPGVNEYDELIQLGDKYYTTNNYQEAIKVYDTLIVLDSTNGEFYYRRGFSLTQMNKQKAASKDFLKAIDFNYRQYDSYYILSLYYFVFESNDSLSIYYVNKALELNPTSEEAIVLRNNIESSNGINL